MNFRTSFINDMIKYGFVAIFALVVDFGSLLLLHAFGMQYLEAATVAFLLGTIVNFLLSHGYVFKNPVIKNKALNFSAFAIIGAVGLAANDLIIWFAHSRIGLGLALSKIIAVAIVFFWNFIARQQLLYKRVDKPMEEIGLDSE